MEALIILAILVFVVVYYFRHNPLQHSPQFILRRFINWFPLGMTYAFLYMGRYNLSVSKNALGEAMTKEQFGMIFGAGTIVYGFSFLVNGPLVDRIGGKKGILLAAAGACVANIAMGITTYLYVHGRLNANLTVTMAILYSFNMFFQSYGAVSIIKVKAYWFHVRERGVFGAIFGTLISIGVYFAFDWGQAIIEASKVTMAEPSRLHQVFQTLFAVENGSTDAIWLVFFIPSAILVFWAVLDYFVIKDTPAEAGYEDFDTHDASSGEMDKTFTMKDLLIRICTSRMMLIIALIEFTTGVVRNGVMQWYVIFLKEKPEMANLFFTHHRWGFLSCLAGIAGGFTGGLMSDKFFQSRRGPPAAIAQGLIFFASVLLAMVLFESPVLVGICALSIAGLGITTHSLMSGTAAADFGGRKATATASGIVDGFVYLGSGLQSFAIGYLTHYNWRYWPIFMAPFAIIGLWLAVLIWRELPEATKRYLHLEQIRIAEDNGRIVITKTTLDAELSDT